MGWREQGRRQWRMQLGGHQATGPEHGNRADVGMARLGASTAGRVESSQPGTVYLWPRMYTATRIGQPQVTAGCEHTSTAVVPAACLQPPIAWWSARAKRKPRPPKRAASCAVCNVLRVHGTMPRRRQMAPHALQILMYVPFARYAFQCNPLVGQQAKRRPQL